MKNIFRYFIVLILSVPTAALAGSIHGTIKDAVTLNPIAGAIATVHVVIPDSIAMPATSDVSGYYSITDIPPNNQIYGFVVSVSGYIPLWGRIDQLGSHDLTYDVLLQPDTGSGGGGGGDSSDISGTISAYNSANGSTIPVEAATVTFVAGLNQVQSLTNSAGEFFVKLSGGSYGVSVSAPGYEVLSVGTVNIGAEGVTIHAVLIDAALDVGFDENGITKEFRLLNAFPNPFNPSTAINFEIPAQSHVRLEIFNSLGQAISTLAEGIREAGEYHVTWNASAAAGLYFVRMEAISVTDPAKSFTQVKKLILLK